MALHAKDGVRSCPRAGCGKSARPVRRAGCGNGATDEPLRRRRTKGAETEMLGLTPPLYTSTLSTCDGRRDGLKCVECGQIRLGTRVSDFRQAAS
jgi:hypothetical protein